MARKTKKHSTKKRVVKRRRSRALGSLGLTSYDHLREAMDYTRELEQTVARYNGNGCPSADTLTETGETIGRIKANLNYSSPESRQAELEPRFAPLHAATTKRYMDAVLAYKRKLRETKACGSGALVSAARFSASLDPRLAGLSTRKRRR